MRESFFKPFAFNIPDFFFCASLVSQQRCSFSHQLFQIYPRCGKSSFSLLFSHLQLKCATKTQLNSDCKEKVFLCENNFKFLSMFHYTTEKPILRWNFLPSSVMVSSRTIWEWLLTTRACEGWFANHKRPQIDQEKTITFR